METIQFKNLYPQDICLLEKGFWILSPHTNIECRWSISRIGYITCFTPKGKYDFVTTLDGKIRISRSNNNPNNSTHLGLSGGLDVLYAGSIRFGRGSKRGQIINWDNSSGHYKPSINYLNQAKLPVEKFIQQCF